MMLKLRWLGLTGFIIGIALNALAATPTEFVSRLRGDLVQQYGSVEESPLSTGIFYDLVVPLSGISAFDGGTKSRPITLSTWRQIAYELQRASLTESGLPSDYDLRTIGNSFARDHIYPIAILNYDYQRIRSGFQADDVWQFADDRLTAINPDALEQDRVFAASALAPATYRGREVRFRIDRKNYLFSNDKSPITGLRMDFDDGRGYRSLTDGDIFIHYTSVGTKTIRVQADQSDGITLHGSFRFDVRSLDTPDPTETWAVQAAISHNGQYATGEAYVYLSDQHTTLTKPVVVVEGLDLDNSLNWDELYELLNQENMIENLRAMGYDAVVLNYTDGTTYVQANAYLVAALLDQVNQVIDGSTTLPLIGASMGGLTCRYALTYMEANSLPHNVRTFIEFDSPNSGGNIPLGIQYWVDFFSIESSDAAFLRDALNTPAARQLLLTHFTSPPSAVPSPDPMFSALNTELASLGNYPTLPRLVAVANGSGTMQNAGYNPGAQLLRYEYNSFLVDIRGNVWALHNTQSQQIFQGLIDRIWPLSDDQLNVTVQATWPWDNAPGGQRSTMLQMDTTEVPYGDLIALHNNHCFIPTISALDLAVADPFYNIAGDPNLGSLSPFDTLYYPVANQEHVTITPENYQWFLNEILEPLAAPTIVIYTDETYPHLTWNSVPGANSYNVYKSNIVNEWSELYAVTSDTSWIDPDFSFDKCFYYIEASAAVLP
ncbi:MAG: esterase/lipase family protein [Calditrichota bacterium]